MMRIRNVSRNQATLLVMLLTEVNTDAHISSNFRNNNTVVAHRRSRNGRASRDDSLHDRRRQSAGRGVAASRRRPRPGCGAGGDAIWLALHGWQVTAVDISNAAVKRVRAQSRQLGIASRVNGGQHDLARSFPDGHCDLISAQYLHTPFALDRVRVLRTAAHAHPTT